VLNAHAVRVNYIEAFAPEEAAIIARVTASAHTRLADLFLFRETGTLERGFGT
jgi:hypothetical protein